MDIPFQPGPFAKESLQFFEINPQSMSVEKYFQIHPFFYVLDPEFLSNRTRRPPLVVLRANPCIYGLFTFGPSVFAENPLEPSFSRR